MAPALECANRRALLHTQNPAGSLIQTEAPHQFKEMAGVCLFACPTSRWDSFSPQYPGALRDLGMGGRWGCLTRISPISGQASP